MTAAELSQLPIAEQMRDETLAMMLQDNEMSEDEAVAILEQEQGELF